MSDLDNLPDEKINRIAAKEVMGWKENEFGERGCHRWVPGGMLSRHWFLQGSDPVWNPTKDHNHAQMLIDAVDPEVFIHSLPEDVDSSDAMALIKAAEGTDKVIDAAVIGTCTIILKLNPRQKTIAAILTKREAS